MRTCRGNSSAEHLRLLAAAVWRACGFGQVQGQGLYHREHRERMTPTGEARHEAQVGMRMTAHGACPSQGHAS